MKKTINLTRGTGLLEEFLARQRARKANSFISKEQRKGRVLDIGCGSYPFFLVSTKFKEKYGMDPSVSVNLVKNQKIYLSKTGVSKKKLVFKDNYFDVVTMLAVFEHIEHDSLNFVLNEIRRVLKKNGVFIITTPAPWADKLLHFMSIFGLISTEEIHEHKHNHPKEKIEVILAQAGFEKGKIRSGFFEFFLNMWFTASK
jgi:ubiquinone/menaquinone biosynthesis C-methylase UbiE